MVAWARTALPGPARIVDPGCGSARFLLAAGRAFPGARLVGVEIDPLAAAIARANLAAAGMAARADVIVGDYRRAALPHAAGPTLFIGNPPYVRHHELGAAAKRWLARSAAARGFAASGLAGLHVHFLLATLERASLGDAGVFVTAAEWLDVNYGRLARELLAGPLGLVRLDLLDPRVQAFPDAISTAVIAGFRPGSDGAAELRRVGSIRALAPLSGGRRIARGRLATTRWSPLFAATRRSIAADQVELGELCRVHRGQVTGANQVWIAGPETPALPAHLLVPSVTRAAELFAAGTCLDTASHLRRVIDLPGALDELGPHDRALVDRFLRWARAQGADGSYIARHRSPWWAVKLPAPAPILATYMARRPPAFVRNVAEARHINIAHGVYPRQPMSPAALDELARYLSREVDVTSGRTYAGGLTKFEPREMERLLVPRPEALLAA
jgi:hypothetical protein